MNGSTQLFCSFCGRDRDIVETVLITGIDGACICARCVMACKNMVEDFALRKVYQNATKMSFRELWGTDV